MILIAGGAGYIGSHTNKLLSRRGYKTVVFDNLVCGHREFVKWGEFFEGDLAYKDQIRECFKKYPVEAVMHFSAFAYVGESVDNPAKYYINNVVNSLNLLEVMREFGIKYFIFSSTCAIYGIPDILPIKEDAAKRPVNPYGRTKWMIEQILEDYERAYGIKYVSLRYFNAAGADPDCDIGELHEPETHLIPLTIYAALGLKDEINIYGVNYPTKDGTCIRDYIHVMDLAAAHISALEFLMKNKRSEVFNLGNGEGYSVREVIESVKRVSGKDFKVVEGERRQGDPPILISDSSKAHKVLGWKPEFESLDSIVETAWRWHSSRAFKSLLKFP
ncbi:MAG: UDP-glucose 4-epimerase GalE [Thermodesulfovibrionales bacterium]|nr:UDP-glucose 4-epimerase GalE [Thermodesulfovibrionales bacterium]